MPETKMTTEAAADLRKSQDPLDNVFGLNKKELNAIEVLGFQLYEQGRNAEAETIFKGLIALDQRMYQGYAGLGALALAERKLDEAAQWLRQAVERNPNDPTVHANLGETYLRMGKFDAASTAFEKAFQLDPQQKDAGANRARAMLAGMKAVIEEMQKQRPAGEPKPE